MTELERRALLGDKQAQAKCTDKGIVLPCPFCGNEPIIEDNRVFCGVCGLAYEELDSGLSLRAWNTRQAPPIGRCGECIKKPLCINYRNSQDDAGFCSCYQEGE